MENLTCNEKKRDRHAFFRQPCFIITFSAKSGNEASEYRSY